MIRKLIKFSKSQNMGYNVYYGGEFYIYKTSTGRKGKLPDNLAKILINLSKTRRMNRDIKKLAEFLKISVKECKEKYGNYGELYFHNDDQMGQTHTPDIIDFNNPPPTQPSLWCNFTYDISKKAVVWNGNDKTRNGIEWINYILNFLLKNGYEMRGKMEWEGEDSQDRGTINVDGQEMIAKDAVSPNQFTAEQVENMKVSELRDALKSLGADSKGLKSILKERMIKIISQKQYNYESDSDSEYDYY